MVTGDMLKVLEGFHNRTARCIVVATAQRTEERELGCLPVSGAL